MATMFYRPYTSILNKGMGQTSDTVSNECFIYSLFYLFKQVESFKFIVISVGFDSTARVMSL